MVDEVVETRFEVFSPTTRTWCEQPYWRIQSGDRFRLIGFPENEIFIASSAAVKNNDGVLGVPCVPELN